MPSKSVSPTSEVPISSADREALLRMQLGIDVQKAQEVAADPHKKTGWLRAGVGPYLLVGDVVAFSVAALITRPSSPAHLLVLLCLVLVHLAAGLYRSRLTLSVLDDLPYLLSSVAVAFAVKLPVGSLADLDPPSRQGAHLAVLLLALVAVRYAAYGIVRRARCKGAVRHPTVILGAGPLGERLACSLLERPYYGLNPVGFVDSSPPNKEPAGFPIPVLGPYNRLSQILREHRAHNVIITVGDTDEHDLVDVIHACDRLHIDVFVVPRLHELHSVNRYTDDIWGVPVARLREPAIRSPLWPLKRLEDVIVSGVALILLSPLLLACALAVRLEGGPGIIFRQRRVGLDGEEFDVYKFRSLKPANEAESQTQWNIKNDHRMGRVGRFLRSTSLDELPQLINILRGDMSLVGPRPERPHFVEQFSRHITRYGARHRVPAGLTGWAQVHRLRGDTSIEDRARFDNFYIANWSPWLDCKIIIRTLGHVLTKQGG